MNHYTLSHKTPPPAPANEINKLADELLMNFTVSDKKLTPKSWDLLSDILDFVAEAEQTIAEQSERIEKLEVMTATDPLTGLLNRRGIMKELDHAIATANRYDETALFVYIDLDNFKQINDTYGHDVGDEMLTHIARNLLSSIRQTDYAARLGGDEFALLLRHTEIEGGTHRSYFIQQKLNFTKFTTKNYIIPLQASFGIAEIAPGSTVESVIKQADCEMYRNKSLRKSQ